MVPPPGCRAACVLVVVLVLFGLSPPALAQQITYEYDALGRLFLMTSPEGAAQWEYDAVRRADEFRHVAGQRHGGENTQIGRVPPAGV